MNCGLFLPCILFDYIGFPLQEGTVGSLYVIIILFSGVGEAEFCCVVQAGLGLAMLLLSLPSAGSTIMCDPACPTGLHF